MPRCGRPARRAVSRPVCANEKNPALSVDRKPLGTSKRASHPARPVPAVAPRDPRCSADACRSAIGRPILHESDVFFVGTCNDASKLPPEFARAERFDGVFFVDLPGRDQKDAIWAIYTRHYGLDAKQARPDDTNWTGAEIKSCCRLASLLDVPLVQAAQNVVPVAVTAGDKIESLRQWDSGRCLSADLAGVYSRSQGVSGGRVRRVVRETGVN